MRSFGLAISSTSIEQRNLPIQLVAGSVTKRDDRTPTTEIYRKVAPFGARVESAWNCVVEWRLIMRW